MLRAIIIPSKRKLSPGAFLVYVQVTHAVSFLRVKCLYSTSFFMTSRVAFDMALHGRLEGIAPSRLVMIRIICLSLDVHV